MVSTKDRMNMRYVASIVLIGAGLPVAKGQDLHNLNGWTAESYEAVSGFNAGAWNVAPNALSVTQSENGQPTLFYRDSLVFGSVDYPTTHTFSGQIVANIGALSWDDDFIGFAIGFEPGDSSSIDASYLLIDWKKGTQSTTFGAPSCTPGSLAPAGLAVSHVFGVPRPTSFGGTRTSTRAAPT
jgi:hypothetical protein